jgi:spermidine synthase
VSGKGYPTQRVESPERSHFRLVSSRYESRTSRPSSRLSTMIGAGRQKRKLLRMRVAARILSSAVRRALSWTPRLHQTEPQSAQTRPLKSAPSRASAASRATQTLLEAPEAMGVKGMDLIKDGWFMEKGDLWKGQAMSLQVEEILYTGTSSFQDVLVFRSSTYGNVLVLDGVIQVTERDEFSYQEMLTHLPMHAHPCPKKVLVIGGGDGGVLREVLKHPTVELAVLVEIDSEVIRVSKQYLPSLAAGYDDPRVELHVMDGARYMDEHHGEYDVIITDSSDPIGPAEVLFKPPFYEAMSKCLRPGGIVASQGECMWLHAELIAPMVRACRNIFAAVDYAYTTIPTYPSGQIGFLLCSNVDAATRNMRVPSSKPTLEVQTGLKYYNSQIHEAAFVLPEFARRAILES